ncbi:hypothetical protein CGGC5_v014783 [Colletotrichum fructicola Nara gc5]|uniref:Uncharacterized protein n=1 Tax=Colletotrichum fructicola (strain Nara gc5) TaxID=1213859 RepID=A0A7J6IJ56_COLFN|nr:hypothetical protein CGGC5_v014783 [Colletotrichum fructicola Nara gc5]KAF5483908.1 hypothetical protein CGCF413_v014784 [Colletotrichum fructicola]
MRQSQETISWQASDQLGKICSARVAASHPYQSATLAWMMRMYRVHLELCVQPRPVEGKKKQEKQGRSGTSRP